MPLNTTLTGFPTTEQIRVEIGRPTLDPVDPGYVADADIEAVIQRVHDQTLRAVYDLIEDQIAQGFPPGPNVLFEDVDIATVVSTKISSVREGAVPETHYPFALQVGAGGKALVNDVRILDTVRAAYWPTYVYRIIGDTIYTSPGADTPVTAHLPNLQKLLDHVAGSPGDQGTLMDRAHSRILQEAGNLLGRNVQEGMRLERVYDPTDDLPTDKS